MKSVTCPTCFGRGEIQIVPRTDTPQAMQCGFCAGHGVVVMKFKAAPEDWRKKFYDLRNAVYNVYHHAWYTPDRGTEEDSKNLWTRLRDAAGFEPGGATKFLGFKRLPVPSREDTKRFAHAAMYSPELWKDGGLDSRFFSGDRDLYAEISMALTRKPVVLIPNDFSPFHYSSDLRLPHGKCTFVTDPVNLFGSSRELVIYDPFGLMFQPGGMRDQLLPRFRNFVIGKALVQSVLAARLGL